MKRTLIIIAIIILLFILGVIFLLNSQKETIPPSDNNPVDVSPVDTTPLSTVDQPIPNQTEADGTEPEIANALKEQISNPNLMSVKGTTVVSTYALQTWGDANKGGEALMRYSERDGWVLVSLGGGMWGVESLMENGVPQRIAAELIAGRKK